jgi:hypothetical protein
VDDDENSTLDYDLDERVSDGPIVIPEGVTHLETWGQLSHDKLPGLSNDPLTQTFSDLDLETARAELPAGFDENYWSVD